MYSGLISGVGPRYCPSIEDKIVRFSEKKDHQIFLEPEGIDSDWMYPNGISTSLPKETQEEYVQSISLRISWRSKGVVSENPKVSLRVLATDAASVPKDWS